MRDGDLTTECKHNGNVLIKTLNKIYCTICNKWVINNK